MSSKVTHINGDDIPEPREGCRFNDEQMERLRKLVRDCKEGTVDCVGFAACGTDGYITTDYIVPKGGSQMKLLGGLHYLAYRLTQCIAGD